MTTKAVEANVVAEQDLVGDYVLEFKDSILAAIDSGENNLVIDMTNVQILGSSAIGVLASAVNTLKLSQGTVTLKGLSPDILRVLKLMGMTRTFNIQE
jgi:anti-anti-sigma factor